MHRLARAALFAPRRRGAIQCFALRTTLCAPSARAISQSSHATSPVSLERRLSRRWRPVLGAGQDQTAAAIQRLRNACEARDVQQIMHLYPDLLPTGSLNRLDCRRITQTFHVRFRNAPAHNKPLSLLPFVEQLQADLMAAKLPAQHFAFVHLLGIYKECKRYDLGLKLWQWLVEQDEQHVSQAAYGAAIELMAYGQLASLQDLEMMYTEALKRFPGTFAEYHLSPDAVVPDRTQLTHIPGIPMILLQGILTARLLNRDWKRAYLALDTALRLYPTQIQPRFFELFMAERPLAEAYTAFMLACRAGVGLRATHLTVLITKIRAAMLMTPSMSDRMMLMRAIVNAIFASMQAGGRFEPIHFGNLIRAFENILPEKIAGEDYDGVAADLRKIIVVAAHKVTYDLLHAGTTPSTHPFSALISLSGTLRVAGLLTATLKDMKTVGLDPDPVGLRTVITSAGLLGRKDIIEEYWERIVSVAETTPALVPFEDWITFTKACRRAGHLEYFQLQLQKRSHVLTPHIEQSIMQRIDEPEPEPSTPQSFSYMIPRDLESQIEKLKIQINDVEAILMSGQPLESGKSSFYMHLNPDTQPMGSVEQLRTIYDEMTVDPHQPPLPKSIEESPEKPLPASTGTLIDELRFKNWVTILEMMDYAEAYESERKFMADEAAKTGKPFNISQEILYFPKVNSTPGRPTRDLRVKIQSLRASSASDILTFRKVRSEVPEEAFQPLVYYSGSEKWRKGLIVKHPTSKGPDYNHPDRSIMLENTVGTPKLTYYIGMKSEHNAPRRLERPVLSRNSLDGGINANVLGVETSSSEDKQDSSATSSKSPDGQPPYSSAVQ